MKVLRYILVLVSFLYFPMSFATTDCGSFYPKEIIVESDRPSSPLYANKLLIRFYNDSGSPSLCAEASHGYIENTDEAYDSVLSMAMMTYTSNVKLGVAVDENNRTNNIVRIEYVYPVK